VSPRTIRNAVVSLLARNCFQVALDPPTALAHADMAHRGRRGGAAAGRTAEVEPLGPGRDRSGREASPVVDVGLAPDDGAGQLGAGGGRGQRRVPSSNQRQQGRQRQ
jgi:hypothetical protein